MRLKLILASAFAASALLTACNTEPETAAPTTAEVLASKTWKLSGLTASPAVLYGGVAVTDVYASTILDNCDKQQKRRYNSDFTVTYSTDSAACGTATGIYPWSLSGTTLTTAEPDSGGTIETNVTTVHSVSATTLVLVWTVGTDESPDGATHVLTETYTAQ